MLLSTSISNFYTAVPTLFATDPRWVFFFLQPNLTATSPANVGFGHQQARTPER